MRVIKGFIGPAVWVSILVSYALAEAAPAKVTPRVDMETSYEDNTLLLSSGAEGTLHQRVSPAISIEWKTSDVELNTELLLDWHKFSGDGREDSAGTDLDSFDQNLSGGLSFRDARQELGFTWNLARDTTRSSELTDSGLLAGDVERRSANINAKWDYDLTALDQISLTGDGKIVKFDTSNFTNSKTYDVSGRYSRKLAPTETAGLFLDAVYFDPDSGSESSSTSLIFDPDSVSEGSSTSLSLNIFWAKELTQLLSVSLTGGISYTSGSDNSLGFVSDSSLEWTPSRSSTISATYSKSFEPSSVGALLGSQDISIVFHHILTREVELDVGLIWQDRTEAGADTGSGRTYYSLRPSISWRPSRDWVFSLSYERQSQEFGEAAGKASSNAVFLRLEYAFPERSLF